jgi:hypothetical protein
MQSTAFIPLIIVIGIVAFMALVSWIFQYRKKEKNKKLLRSFDELVGQHRLLIDKRQTLNKNIIGIDRENLKLLFIDNTKPQAKNHLVALNDLASCRLVKNRNKQNGYISSIALHFTFKQKNKPAIILPVYNELKDDLYKMMRLSKKATYWEKTINLFREPNQIAL